jgi:hypothetical protein
MRKPFQVFKLSLEHRCIFQLAKGKSGRLCAAHPFDRSCLSRTWLLRRSVSSRLASLKRQKQQPAAVDGAAPGARRARAPNWTCRPDVFEVYGFSYLIILKNSSKIITITLCTRVILFLAVTIYIENKYK